MATFFQELWESIFTPGPTPTLLVATNVTFCALQAVLAALLYATHSVHFLVLSVLCGGLWAAINWFARELKAHQLKEEEEAKEKEAQAKKRSPPPRVAHSSDDSETEVEAARSSSSTKTAAAAALRRGGSGLKAAASSSSSAAAAAGVSADVEPEETMGNMRLRVVDDTPSLSQGGVSTEDEWEKVSENENEKDK